MDERNELGSIKPGERLAATRYKVYIRLYEAYRFSWDTPPRTGENTVG